MTEMTLTEQRQELRDAIWLHGPEHFDVNELYTGDANVAAWEHREPRGNWTACFVGHASLCGLMRRADCWVADILGNRSIAFASTEVWHDGVNALDGWNPGAAYDALRAAGEDDRTAQWHVAVEWLDRAIKGGE